MEAIPALSEPILEGRSTRKGIQEPLPDDLQNLSPAEVDRRIRAAKEALGSRLLILGHHYQRDEVIRHADVRGDSYRLAQAAAERKDAKFVVFCGVHFMAETADILTGPDQIVILPDLEAGCSMADMADIDQVEEAWEELGRAFGPGTIPVTYMNSEAALKAFVGREGGLVCTSSNAPGAMRWAFERGQRVLFFPDEHLGRNTAYFKLSLPLDAMAVWDPKAGRLERPHGGTGAPRVILWKGFCGVHQRFLPEHVEAARKRRPGARIIVHPECSFEVVRRADDVGSTEHIAKTIAASPPGSVWGVGTEIHLVHRLAQDYPDRTIFCLTEFVCLCSTMYRVSAPHLLWALENLRDGRVVNRIEVPEEVARWARIALERMLAVSS